MGDVVDLRKIRRIPAGLEDAAEAGILAAGEMLEPEYSLDASECALVVLIGLLERRLGRSETHDLLAFHASCIAGDPRPAA